MLLTKELWMQNDQGRNGGKAQPGMDCSPLSHRSFPEQACAPPSGVTQPKGWRHLSATCHQRLPLMPRDWEAVSASGMKVGVQAQPRRSCSERPGAT